ncbi:MAG TPA: HAMP domain-containing protein, partial [Kofleriaceae bacterium]|nr:HAMP domain-containing protein [Kofleriaceae bacterium]
LTDNVNSMASSLTAQVRNIAEVTTAVAKGDLSKKITVDVKGEILELKATVNTMVDQLRAFASEVTRVAREVGTEGKLGGQAQVEGVAGTWKDLTDSVNIMAGSLTAQVRNIADVTTAIAKGDLSRQITVDVKGEILELKNTINTMVDRLNAFAGEVTRVAREVGTEGKLGGQAQVPGVAGTWKDLTDNVNSMASNLTAQVRNIADVTTAVAKGDLSRQITVDVKGEILELKITINTMVDQLNAFASEVTRVAREVGTEGKLGGQAIVRGVAGTWKDLTDSVNFMASNLTDQVRGIAKVVTAVANGDLTRKLTLEARGEIATLAETINSMTDTLATFAEQVTTVAREVGVEGRLGGQAKVPGAAGTWRDLVDNVNQLAGQLTTQIRAISEVATAVTKGDLTRSITVEASGEVRTLKDNINEMIRALRETTQKTTEQDWLKTNLARFTRMLQGQRDLVTVAQQVLSELAPLVSAQHGVFYIAEKDNEGDTVMKLLASYAYRNRKSVNNKFKLGESLVGQCAFEKQKILLTSVPADYIQISSGLGEAPPLNILVMPVLFEGQVNAVIELASFGHFSEIHQVFLDQLTESIGIVVNTISASMQTETLLKQSQSLTTELQIQQEELRQTNERLEKQAASLKQSEERLREQQEELRRTNEQLEEKAKLLEVKNREVGFAKTELEEKAEQLALTSKYKNEFLANMSHELRTPLNSLLILSRMLAENSEGNLTAKQIEFASTIRASGTDLLGLINDILDLSKIESGTMTADPSEVVLTELRDYVEQNFRHVAEQRGLSLAINIAPGAPRAIYTDTKRLQQVLKNLLSNAIKFTERGSVTVEIAPAREGWSRSHDMLSRADQVVAFRVIDTGIGIAPDKHKIIFESFQQADGTTSRKYGGTGLGLSISREIARLLCGEIKVDSAPGRGSTFTLYLPRVFGQPEASSAAAVTLRDSRARAVHEPQQLAPSSWAKLDDRERVHAGDRVLLVIEEDEPTAKAMLDAGHAAGWKVVVAPQGEAGLAFVQRLVCSAIAIDLKLPDIDGWVVLDLIKHDRATRHVPVLAVGAGAEHAMGAMAQGATAYFDRDGGGDPAAALAPLFARAEEERPRLLIVADDSKQRTLTDVIGEGDLEIARVTMGGAAEAAIAKERPHCALIDANLADMSGVEVATRIAAAAPGLPIVLYSIAPLGEADDAEVRKLADKTVVRVATKPEQLLEETSMFLLRSMVGMPAEQRRMLDEFQQGATLEDAKVLVVDDDIRNIFAVASALERQKAVVFHAESGKDGLALLDDHRDVDVVLMDIMMPEMDGYEVMRRIRAQERFRDLPIIALTAKAMKADREKCMQAGASDYIAKPVDMARLLSMIRVCRER